MIPWCGFFSSGLFSPHSRLHGCVAFCMSQFPEFTVTIITKEAFISMNDTFMKEKPVGPLLASMALPSFLISFLNSVLSAYSDSYVVILGIYYKLQTFLYLPGVFCISYRLRCSGRPGKRPTVPRDLSFPVCHCHHACCLHSVQAFWSFRCLECFLDHGNYYCSGCIYRLQTNTAKGVDNKKALISQFHWKDQSFFYSVYYSTNVPTAAGAR